MEGEVPYRAYEPRLLKILLQRFGSKIVQRGMKALPWLLPLEEIEEAASTSEKGKCSLDLYYEHVVDRLKFEGQGLATSKAPHTLLPAFRTRPVGDDPVLCLDDEVNVPILCPSGLPECQVAASCFEKKNWIMLPRSQAQVVALSLRLMSESAGVWYVLRGVPFEFEDDLHQLLERAVDNVSETLEMAEGDLLNAPMTAAYDDQLRNDLSSYGALVPVLSVSELAKEKAFAGSVVNVLIQVFFGLIFILQCVAFGIIRSRSLGLGPWETYEWIFFRYLNSGTAVSLLTACLFFHTLTPTVESELLRQGSRYATLWSIISVIPPFATHILPGAVLYFWLVLCIIFGLAIVLVTTLYFGSKLRAACVRENVASLQRVGVIALALSVKCIVIAGAFSLFQTPFNWAVLYYHRESEGVNYLGVLQAEFDARRTECYAEIVVRSVTNVFQLLSSFLG